MKQHFITRSLLMVLLAMMAGISMAQNYDLALRLNSIANSPVKYGVSVPFNITVYNQGTQSVDSIDVICILNNNLALGAGNGIWSAEGSIPNAYVTRISGQLDPAASVLVTINGTAAGVDSIQWNLSAEIFAFRIFRVIRWKIWRQTAVPIKTIQTMEEGHWVPHLMMPSMEMARFAGIGQCQYR